MDLRSSNFANFSESVLRHEAESYGFEVSSGPHSTRQGRRYAATHPRWDDGYDRSVSGLAYGSWNLFKIVPLPLFSLVVIYEVDSHGHGTATLKLMGLRHRIGEILEGALLLLILLVIVLTEPIGDVGPKGVLAVGGALIALIFWVPAAWWAARCRMRIRMLRAFMNSVEQSFAEAPPEDSAGPDQKERHVS